MLSIESSTGGPLHESTSKKTFKAKDLLKRADSESRFNVSAADFKQIGEATDAILDGITSSLLQDVRIFIDSEDEQRALLQAELERHRKFAAGLRKQLWEAIERLRKHDIKMEIIRGHFSKRSADVSQNRANYLKEVEDARENALKQSQDLTATKTSIWSKFFESQENKPIEHIFDQLIGRAEGSSHEKTEAFGFLANGTYSEVDDTSESVRRIVQVQEEEILKLRKEIVRLEKEVEQKDDENMKLLDLRGTNSENVDNEFVSELMKKLEAQKDEINKIRLANQKDTAKDEQGKWESVMEEKLQAQKLSFIDEMARMSNEFQIEIQTLHGELHNSIEAIEQLQQKNQDVLAEQDALKQRILDLQTKLREAHDHQEEEALSRFLAKGGHRDGQGTEVNVEDLLKQLRSRNENIRSLEMRLIDKYNEIESLNNTIEDLRVQLKDGNSTSNTLGSLKALSQSRNKGETILIDKLRLKLERKNLLYEDLYGLYHRHQGMHDELVNKYQQTIVDHSIACDQVENLARRVAELEDEIFIIKQKEDDSPRVQAIPAATKPRRRSGSVVATISTSNSASSLHNANGSKRSKGSMSRRASVGDILPKGDGMGDGSPEDLDEHAIDLPSNLRTSDFKHPNMHHSASRSSLGSRTSSWAGISAANEDRESTSALSASEVADDSPSDHDVESLRPVSAPKTISLGAIEEIASFHESGSENENSERSDREKRLHHQDSDLPIYVQDDAVGALHESTPQKKWVMERTISTLSLSSAGLSLSRGNSATDLEKAASVFQTPQFSTTSIQSLLYERECVSNLVDLLERQLWSLHEQKESLKRSVNLSVPSSPLGPLPWERVVGEYKKIRDLQLSESSLGEEAMCNRWREFADIVIPYRQTTPRIDGKPPKDQSNARRMSMYERMQLRSKAIQDRMKEKRKSIQESREQTLEKIFASNPSSPAGTQATVVPLGSTQREHSAKMGDGRVIRSQSDPKSLQAEQKSSEWRSSASVPNSLDESGSLWHTDSRHSLNSQSPSMVKYPQCEATTSYLIHRIILFQDFHMT
eukprot:TRINITY_DN6005_c0_g1_i1.p1 TRINITY_DN6005_c0_g1~~TRINITY_DN6005_c0_g1_i1.p1  ORF type:complete len:1047 (+),score=238.50 TRINITY_DN6005_c0_g1_i1:285-3425(+)